jgi:hypothetical protein
MREQAYYRQPIAATFYAYARLGASSLPFIVYSAFPPWELPKDDPFLAVVRKPFMDEAKHLRLLGPMDDKRQTVMSIPSDREAA